MLAQSILGWLAIRAAVIIALAETAIIADGHAEYSYGANDMRNVYWDAWKGAAVVAVVLIHASNSTGLFPAGSFNSDFGVFLRQIINFPVALFVFLSAYFAGSSKKAPASYGKQVSVRLGRLLPPYLAWAAIYAAVRLTTGALNLPQIPMMVLDGTIIVVGYYVIMMAQMTLISPWLERAGDRVLVTLLPLTCLASCAFTYTLRYAYEGEPWAAFPYNVLPFFVWLPFYIGGILAARKATALQRVPVSLLVVGFATGVLLSLGEAFFIFSDARDLAISQVKATSVITSGFVCLIAVAAFRHVGSVSAAVLSWFGQRSYYFYLSHMLILGFVQKMMRGQTGLDDLQVIFVPLSAAITLCVCAAGALIASCLFARTHHLKRLAGLS